MYKSLFFSLSSSQENKREAVLSMKVRSQLLGEPGIANFTRTIELLLSKADFFKLLKMIQELNS